MDSPGPRFPAIRLSHLARVPLPSVRRVRLRHASTPAVADVAAGVTQALDSSARLNRLAAGASVAVAVGSRRIDRLPSVVATTVEFLRAKGLAPFVVPAMGSHGGGTARGQTEILAQLGITEESAGAPLRATMEVVEYGAAGEGLCCTFDRYAAEADAVVPIARVKPHTTFVRPIESGLIKMTAVGLGNAEGARQVHRLGVRGLSETLPELAEIALRESPVAFGLALVENAEARLAVIEGVEPEAFAATDRRLLKLARRLVAHLPFRQIDTLVVETLGKDVSGAGIDPFVCGRVDIRGVPDPDRPFVHKMVALGVTAASRGNGFGLGLADFTTRATAEALDLEAMYGNAVTATFVDKVRIPVVLADDREAIRAAVATCWRPDPENTRYCQIHSSRDLEEILVSPSLLADLDGERDADPPGEAEALRFSEDGRLLTRVR